MSGTLTARSMLARARRIVALSGAGLSAASGLATFRGNRTDALWSRFDPMALATPQAFARDPGLVLAWYGWRRGQLRRAGPNAAHRALAARGDIVQVTQNVDDLLERAGGRDVIHLHGEMLDDRCHAGCGFRRPATVTPDAAFDPDASAFAAGADVVIAEPAEDAVPRLLATEDAARRSVDAR